MASWVPLTFPLDFELLMLEASSLASDRGRGEKGGALGPNM
jgi:hypothetical protein